MDPINYGALLTQLDLTPLTNTLSRMRDQRAEQQRIDLSRDTFEAQRTKDQTATERRNGFLTRFRETMQNPSTEAVQSLYADYPDFADQIDKGQSGISNRQNLVGRDAATNIYARLSGGDTKGALEMIDNSLPAFTSSGLSTNTLATVRQLVASGKPEQIAAANRITTMMLAQYSGDKFGDIYGTLGREDRANELQPYQLGKAQADENYANTRAAYEPRQQAATLAGKQARTAKTLAPPAPRGGGSRGGGRATMSGVIAPLIAKVAQGQSLTPSEQRAFDMYKSPQSRSSGRTPARAAPSVERTATLANGVKVVARNGKWVPIK